MKYVIIASLLLAFLAPHRAAGQWSADKLLSDDTTAHLNENMGRCLVATGDTVHTVWSDAQSGATAIYYRHSFDGGLSWSSPQVLDSLGKTVDMPAVAASGEFVHVTFRSVSDSLSYYMRSTDGGNTWSQPVSLGVYYFWPSVTARGPDVFVGFNDSHPGNTEVYFRRSTDNGATWSAATQISNAAGRSEDQAIATADGNVYMGWNDNRTGIMQTWFRRSSDNGITWGAETQLTASLTQTYFPFLEAADSNVDYAGGDRPTGNFEVYYKHSSDHGATWTPAKRLTFTGNLAAYPVMARAGNDLHLVYYVFNGGVYYLHTTDNFTTWDSTMLVSAANTPNQAFVAVSPDAVHVLWTDRRSGHSQVYYKRLSIAQPSATLVAPDSIEFGRLPIGTARDTSVILRNTGTKTLRITGFTLNDAAGVFALADTGAHIIEAHDSALIKVRFAPANPQAYAASIVIATDESGVNTHTINLRGSGTGTRLTFNLSEFDFGDVDSAKTSVRKLTITNSGGAAEHIDSISISGSRMFAIDSAAIPTEVGPSGILPILVSFAPTASGKQSTPLTVYTDAGSLTITLSGNGVGKGDTTTSASVIESASFVSSILMAPNPATSQATMQISVPSELSDVELVSYDSRGALLTTQRIGTLEAGNTRIELHLPPASGALTLLLLKHGQAIGTARLVLDR